MNTIKEKLLDLLISLNQLFHHSQVDEFYLSSLQIITACLVIFVKDICSHTFVYLDTYLCLSRQLELYTWGFYSESRDTCYVILSTGVQ